MVLITITLGVALMIHTNVMNSSNHRLELEAQLQINSLAQQAIEDKSYLDALVELEHMSVKRVIQPFSRENDRLQIMLIQAWDKEGEVIFERKELIAM